MRIAFLFVLIPVILLTSCNQQPSTDTTNYVVLISMDGYRWDYPELYETPNLDAMEAEGVRAKKVSASFPSKTFPNHYTLATGLYPNNHGLINNNFWAPDLELYYSVGNRERVENPDFYGGEPIWNLAEKQGRKVASFFWVGSEAPIGGMQPSYWMRYDGSLPYTARIDSAVHWISLPHGQRPRLVMLYFDEPDWTGHEAGPVSDETGAVVARLDSILGALRSELAALPIADSINLIVTSDHGMGPTSSERYVNIYDHIDTTWIDHIAFGNPVFLVDPVDGYEDSVVNNLASVVGVKAFRKENLPEHLNYGTHPRIPDVIVYADSSWSIGSKPVTSSWTGGTHGYDPTYSAMDNIFFATGPSFKRGYTHDGFENVNLYPLVATLLGLEYGEIDGDIANVEDMLK